MTVTPHPSSDLPPPQPIVRGTPGASARVDHDRRAASRAAHPSNGSGLVGRLAGRVSSAPHDTAAWARSSFAERRLGNHLERTLGTFAVVLHDRRVPGVIGAIDHVVVAATGVWIVGAKHHSGRVERRRDDHHAGEFDVFVGGHNQSKLAADMGWQVAAARQRIEPIGFDWLDVAAALCFTNASWGRFAKPFQSHGAWIVWPRALTELIAAPGPLGPDDVRTVAAEISRTLPVAH